MIRVLRIAIPALLVAAVLALVWPQFAGGRTAYLMVSGTSMQPGMDSGDLAVVRSERSYDVGDVVAYRIPAGEQGVGSIVIHRITAVDGQGRFTTKGDNRNAVDRWHPTTADVVGERWVLVAGGGNLLRRLSEPLVLAALMGALVAVCVVVPSKPTRRRAPATAG